MTPSEWNAHIGASFRRGLRFFLQTGFLHAKMKMI